MLTACEALLCDGLLREGRATLSPREVAADGGADLRDFLDRREPVEAGHQ